MSRSMSLIKKEFVKQNEGNRLTEHLLRSTPNVIQPKADPEAEGHRERSYILHPDSIYEDDMAIFSVLRKRKTHGNYVPI